MSDNGNRHTNFLSLTYVEDRERIEHLASLVMTGHYNVCWCVHDKDLLQDGNPDKVHCHTVVHLQNGMSVSAFSKNFSIRERMVQKCKKGESIGDLDAALLYLIHADLDSRLAKKYQYPLSSIKGPMAGYARSRIMELLNKKKSNELKEADSFLTIQAYIEGSLYVTMSDVSRWAASNGHWAAFRRSSSIVRDIIKEHNAYLDKLQQKRDYEALGEQLKVRRDIESVYEAIGMRALKSLDLLLSQAGRPSVKLQSQIRYVEEVVEKSKGQVNVEIIKEMLRDGEEKGQAV